MSVDPFIILPKHFGSAYAMTDYESKVQYAYLTATMNPTPRVQAVATISLTASKAALDQVAMPDVADRLDGNLSHQDFTFPDMHEYSDLDFRMLRLSLGLSWRLSPRLTVTADADYADLSDEAAYVYGDESGSLLVLRTGLRLDF